MASRCSCSSRATFPSWRTCIVSIVWSNRRVSALSSRSNASCCCCRRSSNPTVASSSSGWDESWRRWTGRAWSPSCWFDLCSPLLIVRLGSRAGLSLVESPALLERSPSCDRPLAAAPARDRALSRPMAAIVSSSISAEALSSSSMSFRSPDTTVPCPALCDMFPPSASSSMRASMLTSTMPRLPSPSATSSPSVRTSGLSVGRSSPRAVVGRAAPSPPRAVTGRSLPPSLPPGRAVVGRTSPASDVLPEDVADVAGAFFFFHRSLAADAVNDDFPRFASAFFLAAFLRFSSFNFSRYMTSQGCSQMLCARYNTAHGIMQDTMTVMYILVRTCACVHVGGCYHM
eukprot:m.518518 g.518518  ORF g.518518 m.518518 type:complete len:344 (+) comp21940_c0_seq9:1279-2310(+)